MPENQGEGISRRDLLRKGAVLGGAVVWVTPAVQTLGMGRAFAQTASPVTAISYIAITWTCPGGPTFFAKNDENGTLNGKWDPSPGSIPGCEGDLPGHPDATIWPTPEDFFTVTYSGTCAQIEVDGLIGCEINYVLKGGQEDCAFDTLTGGSNMVCLPSSPVV